MDPYPPRTSHFPLHFDQSGGRPSPMHTTSFAVPPSFQPPLATSTSAPSPSHFPSQPPKSQNFSTHAPQQQQQQQKQQQQQLPLATPQFYFKKKRERLNWRLVGSVDVERIVRDVDITSLQDVMGNLTYCDLLSEGKFTKGHLRQKYPIDIDILNFRISKL